MPVSPAAARMLSPTSQKLPDRCDATIKQMQREESTLDEIIRQAADKGVLLARSHTLAGEPFPARPSLRIAVTLRHSDADIAHLVSVVKEVVDAVI
jgi:7-keto-8-aminopelargonate synthetase-like enzyme